MASGQFRRQPIIHVVFELPDGGYKYVRSWVSNGDQPRKPLELSKEAMDHPEELILEVLKTWNACENIWAQHIEGRIQELEKTVPVREETSSKILQFKK
ncbi:MAG: hypothetical protein PHW24_03780 [Candidatus Moranbacteria bacterium]|nr:hypothetical protein [Candidatus Moranbacteria bacterium]